jgi:hypothetical protein
MKGEGTDHHPADHGSASQTETVAGNGSPGARLLVVDNHALLRAAIRSMLSREPDLEVVGEASQRIGERHYQERNQGGWRTGPFLG